MSKMTQMGLVIVFDGLLRSQKVKENISVLTAHSSGGSTMARGGATAPGRRPWGGAWIPDFLQLRQIFPDLILVLPLCISADTPVDV